MSMNPFPVPGFGDNDLTQAEPFTLDQALHASPGDSLLLGIAGNSEEAAHARHELAEQLTAEWSERVDQIYRNSYGQVDPDPQGPFALDLVVTHRGDLTEIVADPELDNRLARLRGLDGHFGVVNDEDGAREEWVDSDRATEYGQATLRHERERIAERIAAAAPLVSMDTEPTAVGPGMTDGSVLDRITALTAVPERPRDDEPADASPEVSVKWF